MISKILCIRNLHATWSLFFTSQLNPELVRCLNTLGHLFFHVYVMLIFSSCPDEMYVFWAYFVGMFLISPDCIDLTFNKILVSTASSSAPPHTPATLNGLISVASSSLRHKPFHFLVMMQKSTSVSFVSVTSLAVHVDILLTWLLCFLISLCGFLFFFLMFL